MIINIISKSSQIFMKIIFEIKFINKIFKCLITIKDLANNIIHNNIVKDIMK